LIGTLILDGFIPVSAAAISGGAEEQEQEQDYEPQNCIVVKYTSKKAFV